MSNKLKEIFSKKMFDMGINLQFEDRNFYKEFLEAIQIVQNEGRMVEVKGISSLIAKVRDGEMEYPFLKHEELTHAFVGPSTEDVPFTLNTEYGEKTVLFKRYHTTNEIILKTDENDIIYFKILCLKNTSKITFTYRIQPKLAKSVNDIVQNYTTAASLINSLFINTDNRNKSNEYEQIYNIRDSILKMVSFYKRMYLVEQGFGLTFQPSQLKDEEHYIEDVDELYFLLIEKKVIRLNKKLNEIESTGVTFESLDYELEVGNNINLTFLCEAEYTICGQKILVHLANLLADAKIKDVNCDVEGAIKILYGDTDDEPMYISYTGFKTIDEAKQEMLTIMERKEQYTGALTVNEYIEKINLK